MELITDKMGRGVDKGIKLLVATLRAYGFFTTGSCYGHKAYGSPYVDFSSAESNALLNSDEYYDLLNRLEQNYDDALNKEYDALIEPARIKNLGEGRRLLTLINRFYKNQYRDKQELIITQMGSLESNRLCAQSGLFLEAMGDDRQSTLKELQKEFDSFTLFLVNNFENEVH